MSHKQVLQSVIVVILVLSFLVGCGNTAPTPVAEAPTATSEPEQAAATSTPEPPTATPTPVPPTETPTPAVVNPQAGATFSGDLESSEATGSGTINFKVADDANSITEGDVKLTGEALKPVECSGGSLEGMTELTQDLKGPFPVKEGNVDASLADGGELKGTFTSPTEASGTIKVVVKVTILSNSITCDFGVWNWSAKAK